MKSQWIEYRTAMIFYGVLTVLLVGSIAYLGFVPIAEGSIAYAQQLDGGQYSRNALHRMYSVGFSIFADALRDQGLSAREAAEAARRLRLGLGTPVATATARDFLGAPPFTATPTFTFTPTPTRTPTYTPTPTPTFTPIPPTATDELEPTDKPPPRDTNTPGPTNTPAPTSTPTPVDNRDPEIVPDASVNPGPGSIGCGETISVTDQTVRDPAPSSGIRRVRLKYTDGGGSTQYSDMAGGGSFSGGAWEGQFDGNITIEGFGAGDSFFLRVEAEDNGSNSATANVGTGPYTMAEDCP